MLAFFLLVLLIAASPVAGAQAPTHTVARGETLFGIARAYNVTVQDLIAANGLQDPNNLRAGMRLRIPSTGASAPQPALGSEHVVKRGETLFGIARSHGLPLAELLAHNSLRENAVIRVGDVLRIPTRPPQGAAAQTGTTAERARFWPHDGRMRNVSGKLGGVAFEGSRGDPVYSVSSGEVVWIGPYRGYGKVVFVQAEQGYIYVYAGNEDVKVSHGQMVRPGTKIGVLGINPYERTSTLFFVVYRDGKPISPNEAPRI